MDDASVVRMAKTKANVLGDFQALSPIKSMSLFLHLKKAVTFNQFHGEKEIAGLLSEADELNNVRVVQLQQRLDFRFEPSSKVIVVGVNWGQHFDGVDFSRFNMLATKYRSHSAPAKGAFEKIRAEFVHRFAGMKIVVRK
jgi:hypothetical protein